MTEKSHKRRALGKGLGALIPGAGHRDKAARRDFFMCPVEKIVPMKDQPRTKISSADLKKLADSIKHYGILQPLIVRKDHKKNLYELIAGERRWRASQLAGIMEVPVVIKEADNKKSFEMALVENVQREDLNPVEEARALLKLVEDHGLSHEKIAKRIGRGRASVTNSLRLMKLPNEIINLLLEEKLSEGHARAILQVENKSTQVTLARRVVSKNLSVRETERLARQLSKTSKTKNKTQQKKDLRLEIKSLVSKLQRSLGARVKLTDKKGKGKIEISYASYDELDGIIARIMKK